ncbi:15-cis-phytoene synthase [Phaeobacter sp.]|uniref:15-cis-phytoene synthase n=1 Tax=Phaeobacter sp. TaxID=1902409 RepID=UPI0025FB81A1|nr:phytoene/squalene synthase family protein [Phaeobacter sp.]
MIDPKDMAHCREAIRTGSYSFHAASRLLPGRIRDPSLALYAFCRLADDAVDEHDDKAAAVLRLRERLDCVYAGRPQNTPADRAFAAIVEEFEMPMALPDALLEGLAWDAQGREYRSLSDLRSYCARVAAAVGVMMCVLMRVRDADALARAADLGVAMQLTNIVRDIGEDARARRMYLPLDWLAHAGLRKEDIWRNPRPHPALAAIAGQLLGEARALYEQSEAGIAALPFAARPGIFAARYAYAGIGDVVARNGYDSVTQRAVTRRHQKLGWLALSVLRSMSVTVMPQSAVLHRKPLPETAFLVAAAAHRGAQPSWADQRSAELLAVLAQLEQTDRDKRVARLA